jgi:6-phosphogluconolactonase (cycloisomerase 2 family)
MSETERHNLPHLTVAVVIEHEGRFLMVEERAADGATVFNQPAGHAD